MSKTIEIIDTKITDKWGVVWNEMETVRDFLQNFYDANSVEDIKIETNSSIASVSAPSLFDYHELIYLGSDKSDDDTQIGQYGEGWKASVVNVLRNWNCSIEIIIDDRKLRFYFENKKIGKTVKRIVMCEVSEHPSIKISKLIIGNCPASILQEFEFGLNYFYYPENPLFGEVLDSTWEKDIFVYQSNNNKNGYLFYGRLLRAKLDVPIIIVCNRTYKRVDEKIQHDRDRKAFNDEVQEVLYKYVFKVIEYRPIVGYLKNWWKCGHKILSMLAEHKKYRYYSNGYEFPENYYAKSSKRNHYGHPNFELELEIDKVQKEFESKGYICCPSYMSRFGMKTAYGIAEEIVKKKNEEKQKKHMQTLQTYCRDLTFYEKQAIEVLRLFIQSISKNLYEHFKETKYTVGASDEVIGELKKKAEYKKQHLFLNKIFFTFCFADAASILLHEWSHIYGHDGSRDFTDALTVLISLILKNDELLENIKKYEKQWNEFTEKIQDERNQEINSSSFYEVVDNLTNEQMMSLLKNIPEDELFKLLEKEKII